MADNIFREGMQVPSPDEGPTYNEIKDEKLQKKIIMALWDAGLQWDGKNRYELYHQKGKIFAKTKEGFSIEFRSGEHYVGKGNSLKFLPETTKYISDTIKKYNDDVKKLKKSTHAALDDVSSEIQSA